MADLLTHLLGMPTEFASLALRNLIRGLWMQLRSGQQVARAMKLPVIRMTS